MANVDIREVLKLRSTFESIHEEKFSLKVQILGSLQEKIWRCDESWFWHFNHLLVALLYGVMRGDAFRRVLEHWSALLCIATRLDALRCVSILEYAIFQVDLSFYMILTTFSTIVY